MTDAVEMIDNIIIARIMMIVMMMMTFSFCRVTLVERGSPHSLCLLESGKVGIVVPSYHSPKPTLTVTSYLGQNVGLGEG